MKEGILMTSANMPGFENFPIRDEIANRLGAPVILENDANAAALGEKWMGAGQCVDDMILLTLGTGVGGGIISGGKVLHGFMGMAAELGHMTVYPSGNLCGCGNQGCLEKHASATSVEASAKYLALGDDLTAKDVFDLAKSGDASAKRIFASMGSALGIALANLINIFNFPLYLLSGGVTPAWEFFAPAMIEEVTKRSFTYRNTATRIEPAKLGGDAGIYGAAYLPWQGVL
jgi:glucokinase